MPDHIELLKGNGKARSRRTIDFPKKLDAALVALAAEHGVSITDLVRDSARLMIEFTQLKKEGYELGGWKQTADTREVVRIVIGV